MPSGEELIKALVMGRSALALTVRRGRSSRPCGGWFWNQRRPVVAWTYLAAAAGIAAVSAAIGLYAGFWSGMDADWMTLLFAVYAVAGLAVSWRWLASADHLARIRPSLLLTLLHLLGWNHWFAERLAAWDLAPAHPLWLALLVHGLLMELVALACWLWHRSSGHAASGQHSQSAFRRGLLEPLAASGAVSVRRGGRRTCWQSTRRRWASMPSMPQ